MAKRFLSRWILITVLGGRYLFYTNEEVQSVQSLSCVRLFATPWTAACQASPSLRACSNSYPSSQWCDPTISSSVVPFSSCLQSFRALGSFQMSQLFTSGGQSIGVSASASVLPMNIQDWFPLGLTGWISLQSRGLSRVSSNTTVFTSINSSAFSFLYSPTYICVCTYIYVYICMYSHPYMTTGQTIALTRWTFVGKVMSLFFNMLYRFVIAFLPRSKHLLIPWLQSPSAVIL